MNYSITNDKRHKIYMGILIASVIVFILLEAILFNWLESIINNQTIKILLILSKTPVSIFGVYYLLRHILKEKLFKLCEIDDVSGKYDGKLKSNFENKEIIASIKIEHKLDKINLVAITNESASKITSISLDKINGSTKLIYTYINEGGSTNENNKTHEGTAVIEICEGKLNGHYYNNGRDRKTFGSIEMQKTE
jgi:hypothetical protein